MRTLMLSIACFAGFVPANATEHNIAQAEINPAIVNSLILDGSNNEAARLLKLAPRLTGLQKVVLSGYSDDANTTNSVSSVAACNKVREIEFRNCNLQQLPGNLRMLTQIRNFTSTNTTVADGEQFYNTIANMPNVVNVNITGSDFQSLPRSFCRMRVMDNISIVNEDLQLASGYDRNTKTADELRASDTVQFGFGNDALNLSYTCYNSEACGAHLQMFRDVLQGAFRQSNVFYTPSSSRAFVKPHPLVKPPVKGMDVYPDVYTANALTGSVLNYGSGTRIIVPAMAFEDANGSPVSGNVDITYREFRDPVDIVLSGIPMKYDSAGNSGDFKSAGMFEMNASQNGNEVFLRDGKQIDLKFSVTDTAASYNFYRLDEQKGWQYLTDPGTTESDAASSEEAATATTRVPDANKVGNFTRDSSGNFAANDAAPWLYGSTTFAVSQYWDNVRNVRVKDWIKDTTDFDRRYNDTCYFGTKRQTFNNDNKSWERKRKSSSRLCFRKRASGKDYTVISIDQVSQAYGMNPELAAYSGYFWKLDGKMTGKQVSSRFGRKSGINDCRILQEGGEYFIELKYHWGFDKIKAEPVRLDNNKKPVSLSEDKSQRLFNGYTKRLNNRRKQIERHNAKQVDQQQRRVQIAHNDSVRVWKRLHKEMNQDEKAMNFVAWSDYVKKERQEMYANVMNTNTNAQSAAYQALSVSGMGIYNCDQVSRMQRPKDFVAKTVTAAGAVIVPAMIYVIDKVRNMVFQYTGNGEGVHATYDQNSRMQMLATDANGNLYQTTEDQFDAGKNTGISRLDFDGELISGPQTTPESVRQAVFGDVPE